MDPESNQLVGFKPRISDNNGLPVENQFNAKNAKTIYSHFQRQPKSKFLYVIMAQPLVVGASSFVLSSFCQPDFTYKHTLKRILHIKEMCENEGIEVLGWSSDGDARLLKSMKIITKFHYDSKHKNIPKEFREFYYGTINPKVICIQDELHICNKLKNRLFNEIKPIVMGVDKLVTINDLHILQQEKTKSRTKISPSDLENNDKMSARQALKLSNPLVQQELTKLNKNGTKGVRLFLKCLQDQHDAFASKNLNPGQRLEKLWFTMFVFRIIRNNLVYLKKEMPGISSENFITSNTYNCLETNAHNLLALLVKLRDEKKDVHFLPFLMSSQPCEAHFRSLRDLNPIKQTAVNFTGLGGNSRSKRILVIAELSKRLQSIGMYFFIPDTCMCLYSKKNFSRY